MSSAKDAIAKGTGFSLLEDAVGTGKSAAERAQKKQAAEIAKQQKIEDQLLAEGDSEVKRRQALAKRGKSGRSSLIATSQTGLASNLGGSNGAA